MSEESPRSLLGSLWILVLHLPLVGYVLWLLPQLQPAQNITELPGMQLIFLLGFLALPYLVLPRVVPGWNSGRARLGEHED